MGRKGGNKCLRHVMGPLEILSADQAQKVVPIFGRDEFPFAKSTWNEDEIEALLRRLGLL